jgi:hypothetical protein
MVRGGVAGLGAPSFVGRGAARRCRHRSSRRNGTVIRGARVALDIGARGFGVLAWGPTTRRSAVRRSGDGQRRSGRPGRRRPHKRLVIVGRADRVHALTLVVDERLEVTIDAALDTPLGPQAVDMVRAPWARCMHRDRHDRRAIGRLLRLAQPRSSVALSELSAPRFLRASSRGPAFLRVEADPGCALPAAAGDTAGWLRDCAVRELAERSTCTEYEAIAAIAASARRVSWGRCIESRDIAVGPCSPRVPGTWWADRREPEALFCKWQESAPSRGSGRLRRRSPRPA